MYLTSGTFTPSQALIDAGGVINVFIVGGGARGTNYGSTSGNGGEVLTEQLTLLNTNTIDVTIGAGATAQNVSGGVSVFGLSLVTALGGEAPNGNQSSRLSMGFSLVTGTSNSFYGAGVNGYGAGGGTASYGVKIPKQNSGQGGNNSISGANGYCLITWGE